MSTLPPIEARSGGAAGDAGSIAAPYHLPDTTLREEDLSALVLRRARRSNATRRAGIAMGRVILVGVLLAIWAHASGRWIDREVISDPLDLLGALWRLIAAGRLWPNLWRTGTELITGYGLGALAGILLALAFAFAPEARRVLQPYLTALYSIPMIALAPLIVMWFGLGIGPKIALVAIFVFFVVFTNTVAGLDSVRFDHLNLARIMGAGKTGLVIKIVIPTTMPFILMGLRLGIPESISGAVIGEFMSSTSGLGYLVKSASEQFNMAVALAAVVVLLAIVAAGDAALDLAGRRLLRWRPRRSERQ